ncbi:MAG: ABC transporter substrate-binding protein [Candidatus Sericytochromatia bacterium]
MSMKQYLKSGLAALCSLALLAPLSGCRASATNQSVYRSAFESDVPSLDPIQIGDTQSHDVSHNIYSGLVRYRPEITGPGQSLSDLVPDLAESWDVSKDGKTYTFHLRKNAMFHNGRLFEASDVKYSIERLANPKNASKGLWTLNGLALEGLDAYQEACKAGKSVHLDSVKVIDPHTVSLTLQDVIPFAPHVLAMSYYYIVPREEVEKWGDQFSMHAMGTGPYKLKEWKPNQKLTLVRNELYFEKGLPKIDELRYYIVHDENIRLLWFENGELEHLEPPIPAASFDRILSNPKWNPMGNEAIRKIERINQPEKSLIIKDREWTIQYIGMDTSSEPFNDKLVRKAFNYAINKRKIIDVVRNGRGIPARGVLPHGFPGFKDDRPVPYPYDLKKAKALMAQAGWVDSNGDGILDKKGKPFKISFWHNQSAIYAMLGAAVQADLRDLGIDIDVRSLEWASYIEKVKPKVGPDGKLIPGEAKLFRFGWAADYPDPDNYLWTLFSTKNIGQDNSTSYSNAAVDKLVNKARTMVDWKQREKLYQAAETQIVDDAPWIFLYTNVEYKLVQPYVQGQQMHPLIRNEMANVSLGNH